MAVNIPDWSAWIKQRKANAFRNAASFFNIPVFNENGNGGTISYIVTQFDYIATQNFILKSLPTKPSNPTFCPVIKYTLASGQVVRYKLWENVGETILGCSLYNGQKIFKNFVIEIWSLNAVTNVLNLAPIPVAISILYYITDLANQNPVEDDIGAECNGLSNVNVGSPITTDLQFWYDTSNGVTQSGGGVSAWADRSGNGRDLSVVGITPSYGSSDATINGKPTITFNNGRAMRNVAGGIYEANQILMVVKQVSWTLGKDLLLTDSLELKQDDVTPSINALINAHDNRDTDLIIGTWFLLEFILEHSGSDTIILLNVSPLNFYGNVQTQFYVGESFTNSLQTLTIGDANIRVAEILGYGQPVADITQTIQYLGYKYSDGFSLPLNFAACSVGNTN